MTVAVQTPISSYTGNGVTTAFSFGYYVAAAGDLVVMVDGVVKALTTDYTLTGIGSGSGGTCTFVTAPASGADVVLYRDTDLLRETDYQDNGDLLAAILNGDFDRIWLALQETINGAKLSPRAVRSPVGETLNELPDAASRAGKILSFNATTGQPEAVAPTSGTATDLAIQLASIATGDGASLIGVEDAGGYYSATTVEGVLTDVGEILSGYLNVISFGADPTGVADSTAAFTAAQAAGSYIFIPPGTYKLTNFIHKRGKVFQGAGLRRTFIQQGAAGSPAWYTVGKTGVNTESVRGSKLLDVWFLGATSATVAACLVEAIAPYTVCYCEWRIGGNGTYRTFQTICGTAFEVYSNKIMVIQDDESGAGFGSSDIGVVLGAGVYNTHWLNIQHSQIGRAVSDSSWSSEYDHLVADGDLTFIGQNNTIRNLKIEFWPGSARPYCINNAGANNVFINPSIVTVPRGKITTAAINLNANKSTWIGLRILPQSTTVTFTAALVAATSATLTAATTEDTGQYWVTFSDGTRTLVQFTNGSASVTWTGAITATATATAEFRAPQYPVTMVTGGSGSFIDCEATPCFQRVEQYTSAAIVGGYSFVGQCNGLSYRSTIYHEVGTTTFAAATTATVTLARAQPDTSYRVVIGPQANKTFWVSGKTTTQFTLNASAASSDVVEWEVRR